MSQRFPDLKAPAASGGERPPRERSWRPHWASAASLHEQVRYYHGFYMKTDLASVPTETAARFLEELAADVRTVGVDAAVEAFLDKVLPPPSSGTSEPADGA